MYLKAFWRQPVISVGVQWLHAVRENRARAQEERAVKEGQKRRRMCVGERGREIARGWVSICRFTVEAVMNEPPSALRPFIPSHFALYVTNRWLVGSIYKSNIKCSPISLITKFFYYLLKSSRRHFYIESKQPGI